MNRIELAVANSDLAPLSVEPATTPVSAAVAAFFAAAAIGYIVGYNLGAGEIPESLTDLDGTMFASASGDELLSARRDAVGARMLTGARI